MVTGTVPPRRGGGAGGRGQGGAGRSRRGAGGDDRRGRSGRGGDGARTARGRRSTPRRTTGRATSAWALPALGTDRPHVRLGLLWALVTGVVAVLGVVPLALWSAGAATVAGLQGARTFGKRTDRPERLGVVVGAALPPVAAALGPLGAVLGIVLGGAGAWLRGATIGTPGRTVAAGLPWGVAVAGPVALRADGLAATVTLLGLVWAFDAGAYLVGVGAANRWEGTVAGVAGMATVTLGAAAVFVPPFEGASAWVLGGVAAVLAPLGTRAATALLGAPDADVPGVRRLDSLLLAGPAFTVLAVVLLPST